MTASLPVTVEYFINTNLFLTAIKTKKPDACIVDLNLENEHALEGMIILKAIRKVVSKDLIIIISTSNRDPKILDLAYLEGANDYFCKPIIKSLFHEKLALILGLKIPGTTNLVMKSAKVKWRQIEIKENYQLTEINEEGLSFFSNAVIKPKYSIKLGEDCLPSSILLKMRSLIIESSTKISEGKYLIKGVYEVEDRFRKDFTQEIRSYIQKMSLSK